MREHGRAEMSTKTSAAPKGCCVCDPRSRREFCSGCARSTTPTRSHEEALLDIAVRALAALTTTHTLECRCLGCHALRVTAHAYVEERHREPAPEERG